MNKSFSLSIGCLIAFLFLTNGAQAQESSVGLEFIPSASQLNSGQEFTVDVMLKNPGLQNIISVRSWLQYDPEALEGLSIDTNESLFTLAAPGESEFSASEGLVKIGRSNISGGFNQAETKVATVRFKVKSTAKINTELQPYDFQTTELGHTSVNIIDQGFPVNLLSLKPQTTSLMLNGGSQPIGGPSTPIISAPSLGRLQNLKVTTGSGYVDLKWSPGTDSGITGYNIYYGKTSGEYSRRRTLGLAEEYRLEGLNNGEVYYFALTAHDAQNNESDYSDEVAVIVNEPLSSTAPFEAFSSSALNNVPATPQNGPLIGWLGFSALGLGGVLAYRKKNQY